MTSDDVERDEARQIFPFEGLHVYQRAQDAWAVAREGRSDPVGEAVEREVRQAALGIARATARSRHNGGFSAELESARGSIHAAAALIDHAGRGGDPVDERLRPLLFDSSRMLGALIRSLTQPRETAEVDAAV